MASTLALADDEELNEAFGHMPWVDADGLEVWPSSYGAGLPDGRPIATLTTIAHAHQQLRDSPELRQLGAPVGDASGVPFWSTVHVAQLVRRLENMGYAAFISDANGWNWPITCPSCQHLRLSGHDRTAHAPSPRLRDPVPPRVRFTVMQRDGFKCTYCGRSAASGATLHVDHVVPARAGGTNDEGNLVTACDECNLGKGASELP